MNCERSAGKRGNHANEPDSLRGVIKGIRQLSVGGVASYAVPLCLNIILFMPLAARFPYEGLANHLMPPFPIGSIILGVLGLVVIVGATISIWSEIRPLTPRFHQYALLVVLQTIPCFAVSAMAFLLLVLVALAVGVVLPALCAAVWQYVTDFWLDLFF